MRVKSTLILAAAGVAMSLCGGRVFAADAKVTCPVKGTTFQPTATSPSVMVNGKKLSFCCADCPKAFAAHPEKYVKSAGNCPVEKGNPAQVSTALRAVVNENLYYFCCAGCPEKFTASVPTSGLKLRDPVTHKEFTVKANSPHSEVQGQLYFFASKDTLAKFDPKTAVIYGK
jgi:YHS domain-containing protein